MIKLTPHKIETINILAIGFYLPYGWRILNLNINYSLG